MWNLLKFKASIKSHFERLVFITRKYKWDVSIQNSFVQRSNHVMSKCVDGLDRSSGRFSLRIVSFRGEIKLE